MVSNPLLEVLRASATALPPTSLAWLFQRLSSTSAPLEMHEGVAERLGALVGDLVAIKGARRTPSGAALPWWRGR